jgi:hypothetical protein
MALIGWIAHQNGHSYYTGKGISRKEVRTPCAIRDDGNFGLLKTNKLGNFLGIPFVKKKEYFWGEWSGPFYDNNEESATFGEMQSIGEFEKTSSATETNWNGCWPPDTIDESKTEETSPTDPFEGTQTIIDQASLFTISDNTTRNLIMAAIAIAVLTIIITLNVK